MLCGVHRYVVVLQSDTTAVVYGRKVHACCCFSFSIIFHHSFSPIPIQFFLHCIEGTTVDRGILPYVVHKDATLDGPWTLNTLFQ